MLFGWWGKGFNWTDGTYLLCKAPENDGPLFQYGTDLGEKWVGLRGEYFDRYAGADTGKFMPHTEREVYRVPSDGMAYSGSGTEENALFDLDSDPDCRTNLFGSEPELRERCLARIMNEMTRLEVPEEHFVRLGLRGKG